SAFEKKKSFTFRLRMSARANTRRSGFLYGSGRRRTALVTLKIAVLAPIPRAMVRMAVAAKTGLLRRVRSAYRMSRSSMGAPLIGIRIPRRGGLFATLDVGTRLLLQGQFEVEEVLAGGRVV